MARVFAVMVKTFLWRDVSLQEYSEKNRIVMVAKVRERTNAGSALCLSGAEIGALSFVMM